MKTSYSALKMVVMEEAVVSVGCNTEGGLHSAWEMASRRGLWQSGVKDDAMEQIGSAS